MDLKLLKALNDQVNAEMYSSYLYLAMSADASDKGFSGMSNWFQIQAQEEMIHAMKIFKYIIDRGEKVEFKQIEKPPVVWENVVDLFEATLAHEKLVSGMFRVLYKIAREIFDPETEIFLTWFITEQVEEEAHASEILQKVKMTQNVPGALFVVDKDLGSRPQLVTIQQNN
jgi:ferritin